MFVSNPQKSWQNLGGIGSRIECGGIPAGESACRRKGLRPAAARPAGGCHIESLSEFEIRRNRRDSGRSHIHGEVASVHGIWEIASDLRVRCDMAHLADKLADFFYEE